MRIYNTGSDNLKVGGLDIASPITRANLKHFMMYADANGGWSTFTQQGTVSGRYQVPVGKSLRILSVTQQAGNVAFTVRIGYGDTNVNQNSASPPTSPQYFGGDGSGLAANSPITSRALANTTATVNPIGMVVPTSKYPFIYWNENTSLSNGMVFVTAIEE